MIKDSTSSAAASASLYSGLFIIIFPFIYVKNINKYSIPRYYIHTFILFIYLFENSCKQVLPYIAKEAVLHLNVYYSLLFYLFFFFEILLSVLTVVVVVVGRFIIIIIIINGVCVVCETRPLLYAKLHTIFH